MEIVSELFIEWIRAREGRVFGRWKNSRLREGGPQHRVISGRDELTTFLNSLESRVTDGLVHTINCILDRGSRILLLKRARRKADLLAGGSSQRGARSSKRNGS